MKGQDANKFRGYLADKLKRKSVLNSDLFKISETDYKKKVSQMLERIDSSIGTQYQTTRLNNNYSEKTQFI